MCTYLESIFTSNIVKEKINIIFELGSRDLLDGIQLCKYYNCNVYAFECNPDCLIECNTNLSNMDTIVKQRVTIVPKAVCLNDNNSVTFYPFDLTKYDNKGASSMFKIDFSSRHHTDPDYNIPNPQKEIVVPGIRLDTFNKHHDIVPDMLCIDLQGYELNALKSLGEDLHKVKYIITECSINSTYIGGCNFKELSDYLSNYTFTYCCSDSFKNTPPTHNTGFTEFNALFINKAFVT